MAALTRAAARCRRALAGCCSTAAHSASPAPTTSDEPRPVPGYRRHRRRRHCHRAALCRGIVPNRLPNRGDRRPEEPGVGRRTRRYAIAGCCQVWRRRHSPATHPFAGAESSRYGCPAERAVPFAPAHAQHRVRAAALQAAYRVPAARPPGAAATGSRSTATRRRRPTPRSHGVPRGSGSMAPRRPMLSARRPQSTRQRCTLACERASGAVRLQNLVPSFHPANLLSCWRRTSCECRRGYIQHEQDARMLALQRDMREVAHSSQRTRRLPCVRYWLAVPTCAPNRV